MTEPILIDAAEVGRLSTRTEKAIRKATERGKVPGVVRIGRLVRYKRDVIVSWLSKGDTVRRGKGRESASRLEA